MPPQTPSQRRQSTTPTTTSGSGPTRASRKKRKSITLATSASTEPQNPKRIKTETFSSSESRDSQPVGMLMDTVYDAIVTIKVGEAATSFGIHRGLLRRASAFFREELASSAPTEEDEEIAPAIMMREEDPEVFRRFKNWLYTDEIIAESETCKTLAWAAIVAVYTFADRRGIPQLRNRCVDTAIRKRRAGGLLPAQADVNALWKAPGNVFRLRRLILDMFATGCNLGHAIAHNRSFHPSFLQGLVQCLYDMKEQRTIYDPVDFWKIRENYYVDGSEDPIAID